MHPFLSDSRKLLCYMVAWLLVGMALAGGLHGAGIDDWSRSLVLALPVCLVFGWGALSAYYVCRALPYSQRSASRVLVLFSSTTLLAGAVLLVLVKLWGEVLQGLAPDSASRALAAVWNVPFFVLGAALYLLSLLAHDLVIAFDNVREATQRAAEMRALAREAELQMLRAQVNPHFLFNSLNSISALTSFDPAAARAMTIDLADFFRGTLALASRDAIPLREEIALCERFLAIEKRRYGDKLHYEVKVDEAAPACLLPPLCLQPLVENALKHGVRQLEEGGTVRIQAIVRDRWLHVAVINPVADEPAASEGNGVGLKNLRERLQVRYDCRARLQWRRESGVFCAELTLPQQEEAEA
ncbi:MAG: histidine kinase [Paludibacterium sp.]|uniref:sensor histidine kinase n=1 Tax=Paludibacterium sp. TaxID=1917523 RepID=UPI0025FF8127|nr:histidine kinase [Paludibacterium sp.]MBV8047324.1 histidine kinase [Paludibacterium sp.]MBV8648050.1 histidine kinase [Paludibacterium sp.]